MPSGGVHTIKVAPTDSRPRNRLLYRPAMTSKRPNSTGSRLYSAMADRAEPPGRAFKLTRGNQRTSTPRRFHLSPFKYFKVFYRYGIGQQHRACFRELPHYDRFVGLMPRLFAPLMVLLHSLNGAQTDIYFADSTKLAVCHNRRIHPLKVFDGLAARGKTSMGWFFGLKLHFVINHKGQIMALKIPPGNTADSTVLEEMTRHLVGKLYADKGYIGQDLFKTLWQRGLHLITGIRR